MNEMKERVWSVYKECKSDTASNNKGNHFYLCQTVHSDVIVNNITYHEPKCNGDAHYCDIYFSNGDSTRLFSPDEVTFQMFLELKEEE